MKISDSQLCTHCLGGIDYIEHFFYDCAVCQPLWQHVENWLTSIIGKRVNIDAKMALCGLFKIENLGKTERQIINFFILIAKLCISKFKYGTPTNIIYLYERELILRKNQLPANVSYNF